MILYLPPNGTEGFDLADVKGLRREPTPPAKIKVNVWFFMLTTSSFGLPL